jgi:hypothetical protein
MPKTAVPHDWLPCFEDKLCSLKLWQKSRRALQPYAKPLRKAAVGV